MKATRIHHKWCVFRALKADISECCGSNGGDPLPKAIGGLGEMPPPPTDMRNDEMTVWLAPWFMSTRHVGFTLRTVCEEDGDEDVIREVVDVSNDARRMKGRFIKML